VIRAESISDRSYEIASTIADMAIGGVLEDITGGADHYCTTAVADKTSWARGRTPIFTYGAHQFYKLGPSA